MNHRVLPLVFAVLSAWTLSAAHAEYILKVPARLNGTPAAWGTAAAPVYRLAAFDQSNAPLAGGYQFGNVQVGGVAAGAIRVTNTGNVANTLGAVGFTGGGGAITAESGAAPCQAGMTLQPHGSCYFYLRFAPTAGGDYAAQATVAGPGGSAASVAVNGTGTTSVALNAFDNNGNALTGAVGYGAVEVGQTAAAMHVGRVYNTGSAPAQLTTPVLGGSSAFAIQPSGGNANCSSFSALNPGSFCNVYVAFTPSAPGVLNATYTLGSTSGHEAVLALTGTGQALVPTLGAFSVPEKSADAAPFQLIAPSSNSSGAFSYGSSNLAVATVSGSTVTIVGQGSTVITATQAAAGAYAEASTSATLNVGPAGTFLTLSTSINNYNLASVLGSPAMPVTVTVTINAGVTVSSTSAAVPAFATGSLPAGSTVTIVNNGAILGRGGDGGAGGGCAELVEGAGATYLCSAPTAGQAGGAAIDTRVALTVQNAGSIKGGGGGGGGGAGSTSNSASGGGGGGGAAGGAGGVAGVSNMEYTAAPGNPAATAEPGAGGVTGYVNFGGSGGNGGAPGQPGASGGDSNTGYGAAGGAAGAAILRNGNSAAVSGSGTVVGAIQ